MKKRIFSVLSIISLLITTTIICSPRQSAKENNDVAKLALMLPESDVILAIDMDKTLNVVGPSLLNQDGKKIENLKKLMKSLENSIGINPYEINQVVAGVKLPAVDDKNFFEDIDFTVILRTAHSNNALLEEWSKKMDEIEAFDQEKEPTEAYMRAFKSFRYYKISESETKEIEKLNKDLEEIIKKIGEVNGLLNGLPNSAKANKQHKDLLRKSSNTLELIARFQALLKKDSDSKSLQEASIKLQNRWYEVNLEDPKRGEKLAAIFKDAKEIYPNYKVKAENAAKIDALIHISNYEFYDKLSKKNFGLPDIKDDVDKDPNEMMKERLAEVVKTLKGFSVAKQNVQLRSVSKDLQKLENAMIVWLKMADEAGNFDYLNPEGFKQNKTPKNLAKSIKENAKIAEVNGKRLITLDLEKISFWNAGLESAEKDEKVKDEPKDVITQPTAAKDKKDEHLKGEKKDKKDEEKKDAKKKELFAIGYLDDKTMVLGYENGIRSILNRKSDYANPRAAEMLKSFKNPLISFATNSKLFQNFAKAFELQSVKKDEKKEEKKQTPSEKFFDDMNIFGSVEYDGDSADANDLIMSLGFTKNKVEEVFSIEADEESSVFELGNYQISKAIFYDLLNTLKAFKASVSFKFEKKKIAALLESAPQIIEDIKFQNVKRDKALQINSKTKVQNIQNVQELLTSPKFYIDLFAAFANKK